MSDSIGICGGKEVTGKTYQSKNSAGEIHIYIHIYGAPREEEEEWRQGMRGGTPEEGLHG